MYPHQTVIISHIIDTIHCNKNSSVIHDIIILNLRSCTMLMLGNSLLLLWLYSPSLGLTRFFSFFILYTAERTLWKVDQPVARPLPTHRRTHTQNKRTQYRHPCLEWDSNPRSVFGRTKTAHVSDRAATLNGWQHYSDKAKLHNGEKQSYRCA
jgi:hypothetical protein